MSEQEHEALYKESGAAQTEGGEEAQSKLQGAFEANLQNIASSLNAKWEDITLPWEAIIALPADVVQAKYEKEREKTYVTELIKRTQKMALDRGVPAEDVNELPSEMSRVCGLRFTRVMVGLQRKLEHVETYVLNRDEDWLSYLYIREKLDKEKTDIFSENGELMKMLECLYDKMHRKHKSLEFIRLQKPYFGCDLFCSNARAMLDIKRFGIKADSRRKRHALSWLGEKPEQIGKLRPEDYWFYEMETGINLSVELSAVLNQHFEPHETYTKLEEKETQEIIKNLICFCIEENYPYIACVPAVGWKIHAMRYACDYIVQLFVDALTDRGKNDKLVNIAYNFWKLESRQVQCRDGDEAVKELVRCVFSNVFNQILNAFVEDAQGWYNIFSGTQCLGSIYNWIPEFSVERDWKENMGSFLFKGDSFKPIGERGDKLVEQWSDEEAKQWAQFFKQRIETSLPASQEGILLAFCNTKNKYVTQYVDLLKQRIQYKQKLKKDAEQNKREIEKLEKPSRREIFERFTDIQTAVEKAILCGKTEEKIPDIRFKN